VQLVSKISNLCGPDPPTFRRTDRRTTSNRNSTLCTTVHHAVKTVSNVLLAVLLLQLAVVLLNCHAELYRKSEDIEISYNYTVCNVTIESNNF